MVKACLLDIFDALFLRFNSNEIKSFIFPPLNMEVYSFAEFVFAVCGVI